MSISVAWSFTIDCTLEPKHSRSIKIAPTKTSKYLCCTLAKKGSRQEQSHTGTTYETARQIIRSNYKEEWLNEWTMGTTGRALFKHMTTPNVKDDLEKIARKDQSTIFRLRT